MERLPAVAITAVAAALFLLCPQAVNSLPDQANPTAGWQEQMLKAHNDLRKKYRVPPLAWSPQLADYARQWAQTLLERNTLEHRADSPYGENLATASGQRLTPQQVVNMWGAESRDYNHARNSCAQGKVCGHFTQVVWKETRRVGCGVARNDERESWVCNYDPPGNIVGRKPY